MKKWTQTTIRHYEKDPQGFWEGTRDHDVSQNYHAFLQPIHGKKPFNILDLGCGPGRDLKYFKSQGHIAIGLDGCRDFCVMARKYSGCKVLMQNFIELELEKCFFDGIFANASLFHVPKSYLCEVVGKLRDSLKENGIFFSSNPRGNSEEISKSRYGNYMELRGYKEMIEGCGFSLIHHYYRPSEMPIGQRPWLACVFRRIS